MATYGRVAVLLGELLQPGNLLARAPAGRRRPGDSRAARMTTIHCQRRFGSKKHPEGQKPALSNELDQGAFWLERMVRPAPCNLILLILAAPVPTNLSIWLWRPSVQATGPLTVRRAP